MTEPLGDKVGNFLEVEESIDCLKGAGPADLMEVTYRLSAWMLVAGGLAKDVAQATKLCEEAVSSGRAYGLFLRNVKSQGGDIDKMLSLYGAYRSKFVRELKAPSAGFIQSIDAFKIGLAGVYLGVGRNKTSDPVAPDVGFIFQRKKGAAVKAGDVVATVYGKDAASLDAAWDLISGSLAIGPTAPAASSLIVKEITAL
jgi:pyrimidine-nucleoside phosphorylase